METYIVTIKRLKPGPGKKTLAIEVEANSTYEAKQSIYTGEINPDYVVVQSETKEHWLKKRRK